VATGAAGRDVLCNEGFALIGLGGAGSATSCLGANRRTDDGCAYDAIVTVREDPVRIFPYDPSWPIEFERERARLAPWLAPWATVIEHIGSTAVPGLAAKPVIDIMAGVRTLEESRPAIDALAALEYLHFPYKPDVMHWFCKPSPQHRTHHLHLVPIGSALWKERLAFRDALRHDPALAREYAALKVRLAGELEHDREAYTEAKGPFVRAVLERVQR
jgi:GrpB-like predicted nucleotidyltransferase (UPF0157 family)